MERPTLEQLYAEADERARVRRLEAGQPNLADKHKTLNSPMLGRVILFILMFLAMGPLTIFATDTYLTGDCSVGALGAMCAPKDSRAPMYQKGDAIKVREDSSLNTDLLQREAYRGVITNPPIELGQ